MDQSAASKFQPPSTSAEYLTQIEKTLKIVQVSLSSIQQEAEIGFHSPEQAQICCEHILEILKVLQI